MLSGGAVVAATAQLLRLIINDRRQEPLRIERTWKTRTPPRPADSGFVLSPLAVPHPGFHWVEGPEGVGKSEAYRAVADRIRAEGGLACYVDLRELLPFDGDVIQVLLQKVGTPPRGPYRASVGLKMTTSADTNYTQRLEMLQHIM